MLRFGVVGLGFMGRAHLAHLAGRQDVRVVAVHDIDAERLAGKLGPGGGNIETGGRAWDESGVRRCKQLDELLSIKDLDAVVVATPSNVHAPLTAAALSTGKHVFCEKPMALSLADCDRMLSAASKAERVLMIGHVLRFWPEYTIARELVRSGQYGPLRLLAMSRFGGVPRFGARNWFCDHAQSGGGLLDLHIHDVDFALHAVGMPVAVSASGTVGPSGGYDRVLTRYDYGSAGNGPRREASHCETSPLVWAESSWAAGEGTPFVMSFRMEFEQATLLYASNATPTLRLFGPQGPIELTYGGNGYGDEMDHFIHCLRLKANSDVAPPISSRQSVAVALAEAQSIHTGQPVSVEW